jgi:hypothetical protein
MVDPYSRLVGNMASAPHTMKNGVMFVDLLGVVRRLQSTEGTSAAHFLTRALSRAWTSSPSWVRMWGFRPSDMMLLARSTCPFVRGWATATQSTRILLSLQKSRNFSPMN